MIDVEYPDTMINGVPVVVTPAEIDVTNADGLRSALLKAAAGGPGTLVVDMSLTRFCDSAGMQTLLAAHTAAQAEDREVLLAVPGRTVLRVFAITGMDRVIPIFASLDEALDEVAATAGGRGRPRTARR
jgi:anti-sigma B factor antagonist